MELILSKDALLFELIPCALVLFLAMIARSGFGFGHAAFAMPLLLLFVGAKIASPLLGTVSLAVSIVALFQDRSDLRFKSTTQLVVGAVVGIPVGVAFLVCADATVAVVVLSLVLAILSVRSLLGFALPKLHDDRLAIAFGFVGGVLGGAFNLTGIPAAIYGSMRGWTPREFRTTLTGYFLLTAAVAVAGYYTAGLLDADFLARFIFCLPLAFAGNAVGRALNQRMSPQTFHKWIWGIILITSLLLFIRVTIAGQ